MLDEKKAAYRSSSKTHDLAKQYMTNEPVENPIPYNPIRPYRGTLPVEPIAYRPALVPHSSIQQDGFKRVTKTTHLVVFSLFLTQNTTAGGGNKKIK